MQFSDESLLAEIQAGSNVAFEQLMKRHQRLVFRIAFSYTRREDSALDITQNVFLKVHAKLSQFKGSGPFRAWLLRIAHRESLNWRRKHQRHPEHVELTADNAPACEPAQEAAFHRREQRRLLWRELDQLNERQRQALALRHFEGLPIAEIAAVFGCSEGVVKSILFRGLQKLRQSLESERRWEHDPVHALSADDRKLRRG